MHRFLLYGNKISYVLLTFLCSFVEATASQTAPGSRLLNRRVGFPATGSGSTPGPPNAGGGAAPLSSQLHDAGARPLPDALAPPPPPLAVAPPPLRDAGARPPPPLAVAPPPLHDAGARPPSDVNCPPPPMLPSGAGGKHFCVFLPCYGLPLG
jgi:hypothetical protein